MVIQLPVHQIISELKTVKATWAARWRGARWRKTEDVQPEGRLYVIFNQSGPFASIRVKDLPRRAFDRGDVLLVDGLTVTVDQWYGDDDDVDYRLVLTDGSLYDWRHQSQLPNAILV